MNYGQALAALQNGRSIANADWDRPGMALSMQERTGMVTEPFIVQTLANGICRIYTPTQADIFGANWAVVGEGKQAATQPLTQNQPEHAGAHT